MKKLGLCAQLLQVLCLWNLNFYWFFNSFFA